MQTFLRIRSMVALERHSLALQTGVSYLLRAYASSSSQINIGKSRDLDRYNIEVICPELTKFWHPTKNGDLRPSDVSVRSVKKIWWKCSKGPDHEWFSSPRKLYDMSTHKILGCPFCGNRMVSVTNSLATLYPDIASQWHPTKNGDVQPSKILPNSSFNAWWKCSNGEDHVWRRVVSHRVFPRSPNEGKCPFCQRVDLHSQSLAICRPDLAKEWDYALNGELTPFMVTKSSSKRVWWVCENGHHYQSTVYNRGSTHNTGCPICLGRKVSEETSLAHCQQLLPFLDMPKNGDLNPSQFSIHSRKALYWRCPEGETDLSKQDHKWRCSVNEMLHVYNGECPYCSRILVFEGNPEREKRGAKSNMASMSNRKKSKLLSGKARRRVIDIDGLIETIQANEKSVE